MKSFTLIFAVFIGYLLADISVPISNLPQNAQNFIKNNFDANIIHIKQSDDNFEILLSDGHQIELSLSGEWEEIRRYIGIETKALPENITLIIKNNFPNMKILKIKKEWEIYNLQLENKIKIYIDENGKIIGQTTDY
ncbi:PepSY-like domain-containing protein [Helicobacter sp. MIT 14-3879]|uniref:PepSY-like domain-containing protein n=1 Tax=Helicobacter sp. MIT 14-3879 TaxID=2040649 RepID=UPI0015F19667|nr:PepSY-like domain-containing protein [Helicobacter sp. MIT 14-3879]